VARVQSIAYTPPDVERRPSERYARVAVERATLREGHGIEGDVKAAKGRRQLNVMRAETLQTLAAEGFRTAPGELGEQLVLAGLEEADLAVGSRLRLGDTAVIEVTLPREPCDRFARVQDKPKVAGVGRIGVMARVVCDGEITVGAEVRVVRAPEPADPSPRAR
jgi:MOSC domain-containing protein YiiM